MEALHIKNEYNNGNNSSIGNQDPNDSNGLYIINDNISVDASPRNGDRSRSRSYDRRYSRSRSRSRSPRNRNNNGHERDYSRERHSRRSDGGNRGRASGGGGGGLQSSKSDRELGLKYRWEKTVYVSNIPYDVKWPELKDLFRNKVGEIMFCEIFEKDGKSLGVGAIEFKLVEDAHKAVDIMHHFEMNNRKISVRLDTDGYRTRKAKEMSKDFYKSDQQLYNQQQQQQQQHQQSSANSTAALLASLNQQATLAALGLSNQAAAATQPNLLSLLASPLGGVTGSGGGGGGSNQSALLNQLATVLKIEGPVTNRIFVASLDYKVDETKIREVFNLAGKVQSVSLFRDRDGKSRGMAVIEYDAPLEALNAVSMFHNQKLNDRLMTVRFDTKPPKDEESKQSPQKLPSGLKSIGVGLGLALNTLQKQNEPSNLTDALSALSGLTNQNQNPINNFGTLAGLAGLTSTNTPNLGLTGLLGNINANISSKPLSNISKIFIKNIPFSWDERRLKEKFRQAGTIEYVEIKHRDGKSRGCGLIKYSSPEQAQKAVELFNGSRFEGRTLEVKLDQLTG